jgi:hypothetical protein
MPPDATLDPSAAVVQSNGLTLRGLTANQKKHLGNVSVDLD